jgi:hypothetical protein
VALQTIVKAVDISRNTVKKYLRLIEVRELSPEDLLQMPDEELEVMRYARSKQRTSLIALT